MKIDTREMRTLFLEELGSRRCEGDAHGYSDSPGGSASLYGTTAAVNIMAILGGDLGSPSERRAWADWILAYQGADGCFAGSGGHAACMAVQALNLLGIDPPERLAPLAPSGAGELGNWLNSLDWSSTHKELWGQTAPLLATGLVDGEWVANLVDGISSRIHPDNPAETWCSADAKPWRVISCIYHVLMVFDAACIPYPFPDMLLHRLLSLNWDQVPDLETRTVCTDGDWAWNLVELSKLGPERFSEVMQQIRRVSNRRVRIWQEARDEVFRLSTHELYCFLWVTAAFQRCVREDFFGPCLRDTLNDPSLFRLVGRLAGKAF